MEFLEYVNDGGVVVYWGIFQWFFEELQAGDVIEGILAFLDKNILIAIATAERFRIWVYSYCFWNVEESFRQIF